MQMLGRGGKHGGVDTSSWKESLSQSPPRSQSPDHARPQSPHAGPPAGYTPSAVVPVPVSANPWTAAAKEAGRRPPSQPNTNSSVPGGSKPGTFPDPRMDIEEMTPSPPGVTPAPINQYTPSYPGSQPPGTHPGQQPTGAYPGLLTGHPGSTPGGFPPNHPVSQEFARVDTNHDGNISADEFMAAYGGGQNPGGGFGYPPAVAPADPRIAPGLAPGGSFAPVPATVAVPGSSGAPGNRGPTAVPAVSGMRLTPPFDNTPVHNPNAAPPGTISGLADLQANDRRPSLATLLQQRISKGTQDAIRAGLMQTRVRGSLSQDTQDAIKAGLLKNQAQASGNLSQDTQDAIKTGLLKKQMRDKVRAELQDEIRKGLQTVSGMNK